jgi:hypothetical protein
LLALERRAFSEGGFNGGADRAASPLLLCEVSLFSIGNNLFGKEYLKGGVEVGHDQSDDPELVDFACVGGFCVRQLSFQA